MVVLDGHSDLLLNLQLHHREGPVSTFFAGIESDHLDYPCICQDGLAGSLFALFVPPQEYIARVASQYAGEAWDPRVILWQQLAILKAICTHGASRAQPCLNAADIKHYRQSNVLAVVTYIESAGGFDAQDEDLQTFYRAGVRNIGPFWNIANRFDCGVTSAFPGNPDSGPGLTCEGIAFITQANALKMQIGVSYMNEQTFWDTVHHSTTPLVAAHSNAHALYPQPRNLTGRQLRAIRDSGGVAGANFGNTFLHADERYSSDTPITTIVRHIGYPTNIMGEDHVALDSDFNDITLPDELGDMAGLSQLINTLRDNGYDQLALGKLLWSN